jgi:cobyrinic acid a,c-diamide synthase
MEREPHLAFPERHLGLHTADDKTLPNASLDRWGELAAYSVRRRRAGDVAREGYRVGNVLASYVHAHWASNPLAARGFVSSCASFAARRSQSCTP